MPAEPPPLNAYEVSCRVRPQEIGLSARRRNSPRKVGPPLPQRGIRRWRSSVVLLMLGTPLGRCQGRGSDNRRNIRSGGWAAAAQLAAFGAVLDEAQERDERQRAGERDEASEPVRAAEDQQNADRDREREADDRADAADDHADWDVAVRGKRSLAPVRGAPRPNGSRRIAACPP